MANRQALRFGAEAALDGIVAGGMWYVAAKVLDVLGLSLGDVIWLVMALLFVLLGCAFVVAAMVSLVRLSTHL